MKPPIAVPIALLALAACQPADDPPVAEQPSEAGQATPTGRPAPGEFARTAWRARAADGARYTTFLDEGGTYRDLRNGDPWHEGRWRLTGSGKARQLCFLPEGDGAGEACWTLGRMRDDTLGATDSADRRITLQRVPYVAPVEDAAPE